MVKFSARVISVAPVMLADGSLGVIIHFGIPTVACKQAKAEEQNVLHIKLPGQQVSLPPYEPRLILFLSEQEWDALECKPVYGETFGLESNKTGFKIFREAKK